jgi:ADP-ribosylation factor-like protein 13B
MFALLHNLYKFVRNAMERRVCLIVLGIDNAGKTTLLNTLQGQNMVQCVLLRCLLEGAPH